MTNNLSKLGSCVFGALLLFGCKGDFNPDLSGLSATEGMDTESSTGNETDSGTGSGSGTGTMDVGTDETGTGEPGCGNDIWEENEGEACDGTDLAGQDCTSVLGELAFGDLNCFDSCKFDVSSCNLGKPQPDSGMWSKCETHEDCGMPDILWCASYGDFFCTHECLDVSNCGPSPGGTATVVCDKNCLLDCSDGKTCPGGMGCYQLGEKFLCG